MSKFLFHDDRSVKKRNLSYVAADKNAVRALVQAAVNVELFTIPLYMTSLYSIYGMHQINSKGGDFYQGRLWPGMSTTPGKPDTLTSNQDAFNKVFGVFIAEMLHLQLASNICKVVGHNPVFTSPLLQNPDHSWNCYGEKCTAIPHILDLKDTLPTSKFHKLKVKLDSLNSTQILLFLAIEEMESVAKKHFSPVVWAAKYSPKVPFKNWTDKKTEANLPMFGTIGHMYTCLWEYLSIEYTDGTTLWSKMFVPGAIQQDIFNKGVAKPQYPQMSVEIDATDSDKALLQVLDMIDGITDQGEGRGVVAEIRKRLNLHLMKAVQNKYQPNEKNVAEDYPSYTDTGKQRPVSADASARGGMNGGMDHYEIFTAVQKIIKKKDFSTWDMWHKKNPRWKPADLIKDEKDYKTNLKNYPQLPLAEDIAAALNNLNPKSPAAKKANWELFSKIATGSIAGMTTVLNQFWMDPTNKFPMPAMGGTADRMSICWAIFGKAPDLALAAEPTKMTTLYHACQGLKLDPNAPVQEWGCAAPSIYHTCIGSNECRSQGGCGFVQSTSGGGSCSSGGSGCGAKSARANMVSAPKGSCGAPQTYSAPSDNKCGALGGCAVPISASQMYPAPKGNMLYFDFTQDPNTKKWSSVQLPGEHPYKQGQLVHDVAWEAYTAVLKHRDQPVPDKPKPNDIRLAFPPST